MCAAPPGQSAQPRPVRLAAARVRLEATLAVERTKLGAEAGDIARAAASKILGRGVTT